MGNFQIGKRKENEQEIRENVMTVHAIGTGAGNSVVRMIGTWMWWLYEVSKTHPEAASLYARMINFVFANTHEDSLHDAYESVQGFEEKYPQVKLPSISWDLMAEDITKGKGSQNLEQAHLAISNYMPTAEKHMENCHMYLPIATCGIGNTGSSSIVPLAEKAMGKGVWPFPIVLMSSPEELDLEHAKFQSAQIEKFNRMPIWTMIADNAHFTKQTEWNQQLSMTESYNRIDYVIAHSLRTIVMVMVHRNQVDESKLENLIFSGPGGTLSLCGVDIDCSQGVAIEDEAIRAQKMLIDSPFRIECYPEDGEDEKHKFDSLVLGTIGGLSAPSTATIMTEVKRHPYIQMNLNRGASLLPIRFGDYLPDDRSAIFAMMTRNRPDFKDDSIQKIPILYPPLNHPVIKGLKELEIESERKLNAVNLGRNDRAYVEKPASVTASTDNMQVEMLAEVTSPPIPQPSTNLPEVALVLNGNSAGAISKSIKLDVKQEEKEILLKDSYESCQQFMESHREADLLQILSAHPVANIRKPKPGSFDKLIQFVYQNKLQSPSFSLSESWQKFLIKNLSLSQNTKVPSRNEIQKISYHYSNSIDGLNQTLSVIAEKKLDSTEAGKRMNGQIKSLIIYKTIFDNDLIDQLIIPS